MGSKERVERLKAEVHQHILDAAMDIIKNEGCQSLSLRKIADSIDYSAPIIYSYFLNKEAVLIELSKKGFVLLIDCVQQHLAGITDPRERMEAMLLAYLQFATDEDQLYQLMYTVGTGIDDVTKAFPALATFIGLFKTAIQDLNKSKPLTDEAFRCNYLICISFVHGLVALNRYHKDIDPATNSMVLKKGISGIISTIEHS
jgi:AcrR family transcriptional regulator